ncbi:MAG: tRNA guanosine(34) transglycosylase Tgt [Candidatus Diapherotrites archaeon]|nr:tRNA guanosine(34) transglycosylase Tgt [Candidatus Diapherotrites archaeon]
MFSLKSVDSSSDARNGILSTAHFEVETPFFMPVATKGAVKYVSNGELYGMGTQCMISNAFLFSMRPGLNVVKKARGIHRFINWNRGLFTDSGGFQVLDDGFLVRITEKGVLFNNPFDQRNELLSPEEAIRIQNDLGSDVAMCLDDVPKFGHSKEYFARSLKRTLEWAARCKKAHANEKQLLFGITQGGTFKDLRVHAAQTLSALDVDGIALGGLCIGESKKAMHAMVESSKKHIPEEKPVYLMGVGSPEDILEAVSLGVDCFDSAFPTRIARHGSVFTARGRIDLGKALYAKDLSPLDSACTCFVCKDFSRSFLSHLFKTKEETGLRYLSYHNLFFLQHFMANLRTALREGEFARFKKGFLKAYTFKA